MVVPTRSGLDAGILAGSNVSISRYHICPGRVAGNEELERFPLHVHHKQEVIVYETELPSSPRSGSSLPSR